MRTTIPAVGDGTGKWYLVNAEGEILGRLASRVAMLLRGKHRTTFTPHLNSGDHVVVVNSERIRLTGDKLRKKLYRTHSGYPGGLKETSAGKLLNEKPERVVLRAIEGMLPKTKLGRSMAKNLRVYVGPNHPHQAQNPEAILLTKSKKA
jgi:large subunit ribosomal protein L13